MNKKVLIIILIVVILAGAGVGVFIFLKNSDKETPEVSRYQPIAGDTFYATVGNKTLMADVVLVLNVDDDKLVEKLVVENPLIREIVQFALQEIDEEALENPAIIQVDLKNKITDRINEQVVIPKYENCVKSVLFPNFVAR